MVFNNQKLQGPINGSGAYGNHYESEKATRWLNLKVLTEEMTRIPLRDKVCRAFSAAVLLSGDIAIAEEAVHEAIMSLDVEDLSTEAFSICVATLSIQLSYGLATNGDLALNKLPKELVDVLKLPRLSRQCFVLRFLMGLPESICASLLHQDGDEICDAMCAALSDLAAPAGEQRIGHPVCLPMTEQPVGLTQSPY